MRSAPSQECILFLARLATTRSGEEEEKAAQQPSRFFLPREMLDEDFVTSVLEDASHEVTIRTAAALGLPLLQLEVQWWLESELHEGPVAEAVTFPWPALELTFSKLEERDQVRFTPQLDGHVFETILDAGVIGAGLSEILSQADRSPFLEAAGMRRRSLRRG